MADTNVSDFRALIEAIRRLYDIMTEIGESTEIKDVTIEDGTTRPTWTKYLSQALAHIGFYQTVELGLADVAEGGFFGVPGDIPEYDSSGNIVSSEAGDTYVTGYRKINGEAVEVNSLASKKMIDDAIKGLTLIVESRTNTIANKYISKGDGKYNLEIRDPLGYLALAIDLFGKTELFGDLLVHGSGGVGMKDGLGIKPGAADSDYALEIKDLLGKLAFGLRKSGVANAVGGIDVGDSNTFRATQDDVYAFAIRDAIHIPVFAIGWTGFVEILGIRFDFAQGDNIIEVRDKNKKVTGGIAADGTVFNNAEHPEPEFPVGVVPYAIDLPEILHALVYGQSLSIGVKGTPVLSGSETPNGLMYDTGVKSLGKTPSSLVPLKESGTETISSGLVKGLIDGMKEEGRSVNDASVLINCCGKDGERIENLVKGSTAYTDLVNQCVWASGYAADNNAEYKVPVMVWMQGEANMRWGTTGEDYKNYLSQLFDDLTNDLPSPGINGKPFQMFTYQTCSAGYYGGAENAPPQDIHLAQLSLSRENDNVQMIGGTYTCQRSDNVHLSGYGYQKFGLMVQKAIRRWMQTGEKWKPLQPETFTRVGKRAVVIEFHVPYPPLVFDTSVVTQLADGMHGFELWSGDTRLEIASTQIIASTKVKITAKSDLPETLSVAAGYTPENRGEVDSNNHYPDWYAGPLTGLRTTLRDSDPETTELLDHDGKPYQLYNYCILFKEDVQ